MFSRYNHANKKYFSDRFIPIRRKSDVDGSYFNLQLMEEHDMELLMSNEESYFNFVKYNLNKKNYQNELSRCLLLNQERILTFSQNPAKKSKPIQSSQRLWPVLPRKKPLLKTPTFILDVPNVNTRLDAHVVDWSKSGYIATIFNKEVHLWHPEKQLMRQVTNTGMQVKSCVKWNKIGNQFAMALKNGLVSVVDCELKDVPFVKKCNCFGNCVIQAMDWTRDSYLVTCCSYGNIMVLNTKGKIINSRNKLTNKIINVKLSCNDYYLMVSYQNGQLAIFDFPSLTQIMTFGNFLPVRGFSWHPWKEPLVVVAGNKKLFLINVAESKIVAELPHIIEPCFVDDVSFNPISAELVVVYFDYTSENGLIYIVVFSSFDKIVDGISMRKQRIPYLLWDSTGTQLATASADEELIIWDFFGLPMEKKSYLNTIKGKTYSTNPFDLLTLTGNTIR